MTPSRKRGKAAGVPDVWAAGIPPRHQVAAPPFQHGRGEVKRSAIQYDQPQLPHIELSVRISDGTLESSVKVPINASPAEKNTAVMKWLEIIQFGLKLPGAAYIEADLSREGSPNV